MQKKSKTILTAVVTALFVLSIGYFALLAPTTAWYYQNEDKELSFNFGNFDMDAPTLQAGEQQNLVVTLRGTTRFADAGESLFDEMTHVVKLNATNDEASEMSGSVTVRVKQGDTVMDVDNTDGLKWFIYSPSSEAATVGAAEANKLKIANSYSEEIDLVLKLTPTAAVSVLADGELKQLTAGIANTITFSVDAGDVYTVSQLPNDIAFELEVDADVPAGILGSGKTVSGTVPAAGKNIEIMSTAKTAIDSMLHASNSSWPLNYKDLTGNRETAYEAYNTGAIAALKDYNSRGISVAPGETKSIYVVFWAEFGNLKEQFEVESEAADRTITTKHFGSAVENSDPVEYTGLSIEVSAGPDTGGTQTSTLTIASAAGVSGQTQVKLYKWSAGTGAWELYTGTFTTSTNQSAQNTGDSGVITVPGSGGSAQIAGMSVGSQFKVEIQGTTAACFDGSVPGVDTDETGKAINGTVSNGGNTVTILSQTPTLTISNAAGAAKHVKVYRWNNNTWTAITGSYQSLSGGTWSNATVNTTAGLTVPANGSARVSLAAGSQYKLEITDSSPAVHFNNSGNATQIIGTVSEITNEVLIIPD